MKPDLHITLNVDGIENSKSSCVNSRLRKIFRTRLLNSAKAHPEGDEIPEETLPEPFNHSNQDLHPNMNKEIPMLLHQQGHPSHLLPNFERPISQKIWGEAENSNKKQSSFSHHLSDLPLEDSCINRNSSDEEVVATVGPSPVKISTSAHLPLSCPLAIPVKKTDSAGNQATYAKLAFSPASLTMVTPSLQPPKKRCLSPDDDSTNSPDKFVRRPILRRTLKFDTPVKGVKIEEDINEKGSMSVDNNILEVLLESLQQSIREKERKAMEDQDPAISQAKRRRQMIVGLPKLFDMIHFSFQPIKRSVMTKEELIHKILASHIDIVDRREVDEQLKLLQEQVPEWISEKLSSNGDLLLCIKKTSSPATIDSIRQKLMMAKERMASKLKLMILQAGRIYNTCKDTD